MFADSCRSSGWRCGPPPELLWCNAASLQSPGISYVRFREIFNNSTISKTGLLRIRSLIGCGQWSKCQLHRRINENSNTHHKTDKKNIHKAWFSAAFNLLTEWDDVVEGNELDKATFHYQPHQTAVLLQLQLHSHMRYRSVCPLKFGVTPVSSFPRPFHSLVIHKQQQSQQQILPASSYTFKQRDYGHLRRSLALVCIPLTYIYIYICTYLDPCTSR